MIQAVTFDLWDTVLIDDTDEPKRAALGLLPKPAARLQLLTEEITRHHPALAPEQIKQAFDEANRRFNHAWKVEHHTPPVAERFCVVFDLLGVSPTPGYPEVVREIEEMEVNVPPDFVPGVAEAIRELAGEFKLGVISDTIHTTGKGLRRLLDSQGILKYFRAFVFSDEVGASKPKPLVFERAAAELGVPFSEIVHVGDRESNDVEGPRAMGMKTIFFTGALDRGSAQTQANAICRDYASLPAVVRKLNQSSG